MMYSKQILVIDIGVVVPRHIILIFGICISKHYNSTPYDLEFMQCGQTPNCWASISFLFCKD
jgi:hypothetical protein